MAYEDLVDLVGRALPVDEFVDRITMMGSGPEGVRDGILTFDVFPNRPDMYSVEGIARGLRGYLGLETGLPSFSVRPSGIELRVDGSVADVRPYAVGGIVRGVELEDRLLRSLVDLQEKLHLTLGRRRRKVAIGIHDLDKVRPPFTYRAVPPSSVRFMPLGTAEEMDLLTILARHEKGREYAHLVADRPLFPVITDARGAVLSFPPVINGVLTALTPDTENLFIDVTGTDFEAVRGALNILSSSLAERGGRIESVRTAYPDRVHDTPDLTPHAQSLDLDRANALLGLTMGPDQAVGLLKRMRYDARAEGTTIHVLAPAYRTDILHPVDVAEDLAIAWGYDRYARQLPRRQTIGEAHPLNDLSEVLRVLLIGYGYQEIMSLSLSGPAEPYDSPDRITVRNPVTSDFDRLRSTLVPSLLTILRLNKHRELPQRIFEVADVVVDSRNVRRIAAATIHHKASFTEAKSLVLSVLRDLGRSGEVEPAEDANYIPGRIATVHADGREVGRFGEVHPRVLEGYGLVQPAIACELDVAVLPGF